MPSLDPGDVVELVYDRFEDGVPGVVATPGSWRFASFSEPFLLSRWVLYVPRRAERASCASASSTAAMRPSPGRAAQSMSWCARTARGWSPRCCSQPSELEVLPWAEYGADRERCSPTPPPAGRRWLRWQSSVPADIEGQLRDFIAANAGDGRRARARAEALYAGVGEHVLEYGGGGDVTDVWLQHRGDPTGLLFAIYRLADLDVAWAVAQQTAPEVDPQPVAPFLNGDRYQAPILRLDLDGEIVWVAAAIEGTAFGSLPAAMMGARVLVLADDGGYTEEEAAARRPRGAVAAGLRGRLRARGRGRRGHPAR